MPGFKRQESREHRPTPLFWISSKTTLVLSLTSVDSRLELQGFLLAGGQHSVRVDRAVPALPFRRGALVADRPEHPRTRDKDCDKRGLE